MYLPPHFRSDDSSLAATLMREHPFASLISTDEEGLPFVTRLPLHLETHAAGDDGPRAWTLWGHCAKPNPHWRYLESRPRAVVSFLGPHAYLSPKAYPDLERVPSWNYVALDCTVDAELITDPGSKDALLKRLIVDHEPAYAAQWRDLGETFQKQMLAGIVGFRLRVFAWQLKIKLNQHRAVSHPSLYAVYSSGDDDARGVARWMERIGMVSAPNLASDAQS